MSAAAFLASSEDKGRRHDDVPRLVLLDIRCHMDGRPNATTATSKTSNDLPIQVTFCAVPPPDLSYLFVHCPGLEGGEPTDLSMVPRVISTDADLVLLRVNRDPMGRMFRSHCDYFVYKMNATTPQQSSRLDLLPNPYPDRFRDNEMAVLSCGDDRYVVAALQCTRTFMLHLYHSAGPDGKPGSWISQRLPLEDPQRDMVCPFPEIAARRRYHETTKVITLGGPKGTVGWVDLWRGILLCDVLDECPKLRDIPLPMSSKSNWDIFLNICPYYCHDITVNLSKDTIKYVEMEIAHERFTSHVDSCYEWVMSSQDRQCQSSYSDVRGRWQATTWSMAIPVTTTSWVPGGSWHRECTICSEDIDLPADNPRLLHKLMSSSDDDNKDYKATEATTLSPGCLLMAHPTLSVADDDDVVYFLSKGTSTRSVDMIVAVDMRAGTLQGATKLDPKRNVGFMRRCLAGGISI